MNLKIRAPRWNMILKQEISSLHSRITCESFKTQAYPGPTWKSMKSEPLSFGSPGTSWLKAALAILICSQGVQPLSWTHQVPSERASCLWLACESVQIGLVESGHFWWASNWWSCYWATLRSKILREATEEKGICFNMEGQHVCVSWKCSLFKPQHHNDSCCRSKRRRAAQRKTDLNGSAAGYCIILSDPPAFCHSLPHCPKGLDICSLLLQKWYENLLCSNWKHTTLGPIRI